MTAEDRGLIDWLRDIETAAAAIVRHVNGTTLERFEQDEAVAALVTLKLQIMGEAARYLVARHPAYAGTCELPLGGMRMMRNRLIHGYFTIRQVVVWGTARDDVPEVLATVRALIAAEETR